MKTQIISAFPACGKTSMFLHAYGDLKVSDSDSSKFSWILDGNGNPTKERDPSFPGNYIEHIRSLIGKVDIIFVSSHETVQKALSDSFLCWSIVMPDKSLLNEWVGRCYRRGDSQGFIDALIENWDDWTNVSLDIDVNAKSILGSGEYVVDKMYFLETITAN